MPVLERTRAQLTVETAPADGARTAAPLRDRAYAVIRLRLAAVIRPR